MAEQENQDFKTAFTEPESSPPAPSSPEAQPATPPVEPPIETPVEPPPAEPPVPEPATPSAAEAIVQRAQSLGIDVSKYGTTEEFITDLLDRNANGQQAMQALAAQRQQTPPPPTVAPEPEPEAEWSLEKHLAEAWKAPQRDPKWDAILSMRGSDGNSVFTKDSGSGLIVATPGNESFAYTFADQLQAMNAYEQANSSQVTDFLANPTKLLWEAFEEPIRRLVGGQLDERFTQRDTTSQERAEAAAIEKFQAEHASTLYDQSGQLSEKGKALHAEIERIQQAANDPIQLLQLAQQRVWGEANPAPNAPAPNAAPTPPQPKPVAEPSWLEQAVQTASHNPSASGASSAPPPQDDPGQLTEYEIKNAFTLAHQKEVASA